MGIGGTIWVHIPGGVLIPIPLTTAGVGVGGRNFPSGFTFDAAPWTLETGSVKWTTATFSTVTLPGGTQVVITNTFPTSSTRMGTTSAAGSQLTLVNPTYVVGVGNVLPVFTDFEIRFTDGLGLPEFLLPTPPNQGPVASCVESVNPSGKKTPPAGSTTLPGSQGGENDDGFYELVGEDAEDGTAPLFVTNASGSATFGPFASGSVVKITEAPGATPTSQSMGGPSSAVAAHVKLDSDAFVFAVDSEGEVSPVVSCLVPPLPK
jgi:hypothetical protein